MFGRYRIELFLCALPATVRSMRLKHWKGGFEIREPAGVLIAQGVRSNGAHTTERAAHMQCCALPWNFSAMSAERRVPSPVLGS